MFKECVWLTAETAIRPKRTSSIRTCDVPYPYWTSSPVSFRKTMESPDCRPARKRR